MTPPVKKNQEYELVIESLGSNGEGIGHIDGFAVFVVGALPGELVRIHIVQVKTRYAYGKLLALLRTSPDRTEPACSLMGHCGGCQLGHLSYEAQLRFKRDKVKQALERIGHFSPEFVQSVLAAETIGMQGGEWQYYRNKAQFPVRFAEGKIEAGFFAPRSHRLLPVENCLIQSEIANHLVRAILQFVREQKVSIYDEVFHKGVLRHILIRNGFSSNQVSVCLVINANSLPQENAWKAFMLEHDVDSFSININREKSNVILGSETRTLQGKPYIEDMLDGLTFQISPASFYQVNPPQTERLYNLALEMAGLTGNETVWDAYCGAGTISLFLAKHAKKVYGVEIVPQAIQNAKENAERNGIQNAEFYTGKAEDVIPSLYREQGIRADVMVVDPPRAGCEESLLQTFLEMQPERIVYVSCDPATLARDLNILCSEGQYEIQRVQPVDLFPMTFHVENVALLAHKKKNCDFLQ